jgi:hypothetical protein
MVHHIHGRNKSPLTIEERFLQYVNKTETCWLWTGYIRSDGYANFRPTSATTQLAHRVAYKLWNGDIPKKKLVRHKCDNPKCVNPNHLELGTQQDNMNDMVERGRYRNGIGMLNNNVKLTDYDIKEFRVFLELGLLQKDIEIHYNVKQGCISCIKTNKKWTHVI